MEREQESQTRNYLELHRLLRNEKVGTGVCRLGYVVSETIDNQPQTLVAAKKLITRGVIKKALIADPLPGYSPGFPGANYLRQEFDRLGVEEYESFRMEPDQSVMLNTQTEMTALTQYLKEARESSILLIAPWFHALRSYITAVSEFKKAELPTKVFVMAVRMNPYETVTHSQGIQKDSRRKIFFEEIRKCERYKNLIPVGEALKIYKRDRGLLYSQ